METRSEQQNTTKPALFELIDNSPDNRVPEDIKNYPDLASHLASLYENKTPAHYAATKKKFEIVVFFVRSCKRNEQNECQYDQALLEAVTHKNFECAQVLLENGSSQQSYWTDAKNYSLHKAAENKQPEMIQLLLKYTDKHITRPNHRAMTPLDIALSTKQWKCVDIMITHLISKKQNLDAILLKAISHKASFLIIKKIIDAGANLAILDKENNSALHLAAQQDHHEVIAYLLSKGADPKAVNDENKTPIECACGFDHSNAAQILLEKTPIKPNDNEKVEALHYENALIKAIKRQNYFLVKLLLKHQAPIHRCNAAYGHIALYWAVKYCEGVPDIVTLLLDSGASPLEKNQAGKTTIDLAKELNHAECLARLNNHPSVNQPVVTGVIDLLSMPSVPVVQEVPNSTNNLLTQGASLVLSQTKNLTEMMQDIKMLDEYYRLTLNAHYWRLQVHQNFLTNMLAAVNNTSHEAYANLTETSKQVAATFGVVTGMYTNAMEQTYVGNLLPDIKGLEEVKEAVCQISLWQVGMKQFCRSLYDYHRALVQRIHQTKWELGNRIQVYPTHIDSIYVKLADFQKPFSTYAGLNIVNAFLYVYEQLQEANASSSKLRSKSTTEFYRIELNAINDLFEKEVKTLLLSIQPALTLAAKSAGNAVEMPMLTPALIPSFPELDSVFNTVTTTTTVSNQTTTTSQHLGVSLYPILDPIISTTTTASTPMVGAELTATGKVYKELEQLVVPNDALPSRIGHFGGRNSDEQDKNNVAYKRAGYQLN